MLNKTKILILDDYPDLLYILSLFLAEKFYEVCTVTSSGLFKEELIRFKPDLIILDIILKDAETGREICSSIKENEDTAHIPVILMSANHTVLKNYEECKADAILEKPFNLSELIFQIETLIIPYIG